MTRIRSVIRSVSVRGANVDFSLSAVDSGLRGPVDYDWPPVFTADPSITGTAAVGNVLTGVDGTVTGGTVTARQWLRDGVAISGATGSTYTLVEADAGAGITFRNTATGVGGTAQATSVAAFVGVNPTINSRHFGDSITESNAGGPGDGWVARLAGFMDGTQDNLGIGGQTSTQIKDRVVAQSSENLAKMHTFMGGTNNPTALTTILADYAASDTAITGPLLVLGPIGSGNMLGTIGRLNRVSEELRTTYGNNFLDIQHCFRRAGPFGSDLTAVRAGTLPPALMADATHPSNATGAPLIAEEVGRAMRALSGLAEPFVHDDLVTWSSAAAEDAVIHTARKLGTVTTWAYANDPADNLFKVNSSGQILRGAGTTYPDGGIATINLRGTNVNGSHTGRLLMAREAETDQPIYGVTVTGNGSMLTRMTVDSETAPFMANGTELSVVMLVRFPEAVTASAALTATHNTVINSGTAGQMRLIPRDTSGAAMGTAQITSPAVTDKSEWHWIMLSFDTANSLASAVSASPTDGVQSTSTISGSLTTGTMGLSRINGLFTNNSGNSAPWRGELKMLWIAPEFIDFTSATERNRFFNSGTLAPVTIDAGGVINSITPAIYLRGRCGDWLKGRNFASGGNRLFAPFPIDAENAVFLDADETLVAPEITASSISGTPQDGQVLTANATVTGYPLPSLAYQWQKNGTNISGQTSQTITLNAAGMSLTAGDIISCEITATNSEGSDTAEPTIEFAAAASDPTFVGLTTAGASSGSSIVINVPAEAEAGDLLVVYGLTSSASSYDTPSGWLTGITASGHVVRYLSSYDGTTASYTFSDAAATQQSITMLAVRNGAFDVVSAVNTMAASPTTNSINVAQNNSLIIGFVGALAAGVTYFTPAGWTARGSFTANRSLAVFTRDALASSGPLAGQTFARDGGSVNGRAFQLAVSPA